VRDAFVACTLKVPPPGSEVSQCWYGEGKGCGTAVVTSGWQTFWHIMHCGSAGSGLPPGVVALAPAVAEPIAVGTADGVAEALGAAVTGAVATTVGAALAALTAAVGMFAVVVVGAAVEPLGSARWHAGRTARARR
jgi:hypothetical protein